MVPAAAAAVTATDRSIEVAPERLHGWIKRFEARHGQLAARRHEHGVELSAADGARAELVDLWGGWAGDGSQNGPRLESTRETIQLCGEFINHQTAERRVGIILVRRRAHAVGILRRGQLVASKVEREYVQSRTKAGGWSQQRFARRRKNQTDKSWQSAADTVARVLLNQPLDAVLCGGDRPAIDAVLADPRLSAVARLRTEHPVLPVAEPRQQVLLDSWDRFAAVPIRLNDLA